MWGGVNNTTKPEIRLLSRPKTFSNMGTKFGVTKMGEQVSMEQIEQEVLGECFLTLSRYFTSTLNEEFFIVLSKFYSEDIRMERAHTILSKYYTDDQLINVMLSFIIKVWRDKFLCMPNQDTILTKNEIQAKGEDQFFDHVYNELLLLIGHYESLLQIKDLKLEHVGNSLLDGEFFVSINWSMVSTNNRNNVIFPFYISE